MTERFDVIVVGTGFGGAIAGCRLAEGGAKVLILERGRRWTRETYPRSPSDPWIYRHDRPEKKNGWLDLRWLPGMIVAQGAGVGGGSLCYSSVVMEADRDRFEEGWPPEITYDELRPYYDKVRSMLALAPLPEKQWTDRNKLLRRAADRLGVLNRVEAVPLALSFDPEYSYDLPDPIHPKHSKTFVNAHGVTQGTCVHLGNCDIGCDVGAKNTLDLNYIPRAERAGAEVRPLHLVRFVEPVHGGGYRVVFDQIRDGRRVPGSATAARVVLSAGSLGTTEILLRSRDEHGTLPRLSSRLGCGWSANGNFLTPAFYDKDVVVNQGIGPTISVGLNYMDGSRGHRFFVEDDGFPNLLVNAMRQSLGPFSWLGRRVLGDIWARGLDEINPTDSLMVWLGEGLDGSPGTLSLGRRWLNPWRKSLTLSFRTDAAKGLIEAIIESHREITAVEGGKLWVPRFWRWFQTLLTVHPLGGCAVGRTPEEGVVDHRGEVFHYPNLFVADGSILPRPTGRNPSMTIGALSERVAELMLRP